MCCSEIEELKTNKCELGTYVNIDFGNWSEIPHHITRKVHKICSNTFKYGLPIWIFICNYKRVKHTPRSMELEFVGGTVEIKSYQGRIIGGTEEECLALNKTLLECGRVVRIGPMYNDIWTYDLSCKRFDDLSCLSTSFRKF